MTRFHKTSLLFTSLSLALLAGCGMAAEPESPQNPLAASVSETTATAVKATASSSASFRWRIRLLPGQSLAQQLRTFRPDDTINLLITLAPGIHDASDLIDINRANSVEIIGEAGASINNAVIRNSSHLGFVGIRFLNKVVLDGASHISLSSSTFTATGTNQALQIYGQGPAGASHDIDVTRSSFISDDKSILVLGAFAPSVNWNHDIWFEDNEITCGTGACIQLSGARDMTIKRNVFDAPVGTANAILTAGATRVQIVGNRFSGNGTGSAIQIATPGSDWDNYPGVDNMISSQNAIANNIITDWTMGITFAAAVNTDVVFNTFDNVQNALFMSNHKPKTYNKRKLILERTVGTRAWNNILTSVLVIGDETRPAFESNNLYTKFWAVGGTNAISADPLFGPDYTLSAGSAAIGAGIVVLGTPADDFNERVRDSQVDIGAREFVSSN